MKRLTKGKNGVISPNKLDCYYNTREASLWVPWGHHTGLLLVTANEQSTAPGNTWGLTLKPGIDCLNHLNTFLGDLDDMEDYMKTTVKCKVRNFLNRHFESFASYATATITKENGNHL